MKVVMNVNRNYACLFAGLLILLGGMFAVNALNSGDPVFMGHTSDEILGLGDGVDWNKYGEKITNASEAILVRYSDPGIDLDLRGNLLQIDNAAADGIALSNGWKISASEDNLETNVRAYCEQNNFPIVASYTTGTFYGGSPGGRWSVGVWNGAIWIERFVDRSNVAVFTEISCRG